MNTVGFMIMAHNNFEQLNVFIGQLLEYPGSYVYIFVDGKARDFHQDMIIDNDRVKILEDRYETNWGDYSLVQATIDLMGMAALDNLDYVTLCSGADLAVRPVGDFADYLSGVRDDVFVDAKKMPIDGWGRGAGGFERILVDYPKFFRKKIKKRSIMRYARGVYQLLGSRVSIVHKRLPEMNFYGGSQWFTVSGAVLESALEFIRNNKSYASIYKYSLAPDEIFFNTLFVHIAQVIGVGVNIDDNLRYIDWTVSNSTDIGSPRILISDDYDKLIVSKKFIARKFDVRVDSTIVDKLSQGTTYRGVDSDV